MKNNDAEYLRALATLAMERSATGESWKIGDIADRYDKLCDASNALIEAVTEKVFNVTSGKEVGTSVGARDMNEEIDGMACELQDQLDALGKTL